MTEKELILLRMLYNVGEKNLGYLSDKGIAKLEELANKADNENIIW